jgi:hypothetical protein
MKGRPVTIRTMDVGADKPLDKDEETALNPALGLRAIRYCLAEPQMFLTQLRAILRASAYGPINLLIPKMVFCGLVTACLFAGAPTVFSPLARKPTIEGVVLAPSAFSITLILVFPSIMATHEFVVPRSIPITFDIKYFLFFD